MITNRITAKKDHTSLIYTRLLLPLCLWFIIFGSSRLAFALPPQFQDQLVKSGLNYPTSMAYMPDGRILVTEKAGQIWILDSNLTNPVLTSYLTITDIDTVVERGLLDVVLDPGFPSTPYIYVLYTRNSDQRIHVSRFTHQGNTATTELSIWHDPVNYGTGSTFHYGGSLSFGPDGYLYVATGDQRSIIAPQDLTRARGKILRIASDGSIPIDNPFNDGNGPNLDEIWAYGLRNPWRARWDLQGIGANGPRLYIAEVGNNNNNTSNEDLHIGREGANYGYPVCDGATCNPSHQQYDPNQVYDLPLFTYPHNGTGAAIIGGIVYHGTQFPAAFADTYFYGDYPRQHIRYLTFDSNGAVATDNNFQDSAGPVIDIKQGGDGALYYIQIASDFNDNSGALSPNTGALRRIRYNAGNQAPQITTATADITAGESPLLVQFSATATDVEDDPLNYVWLFGDGNQASGSDITYDYTESGVFQARLQVSDLTNTTVLDPPITITVDSAPEVTIVEPVDGSFFRAGETINFQATATDPDGVLTENSYEWTINLAHNEHAHPELGPLSGSSGSFEASNSDHSYFADTGFILSVKVTDSDGISTTKSVRINPEEVDITFDTQPSGISLFLDNETLPTPIVYDSAIGFESSITAPPTACLNNTEYSFASWSNGATRSFNYTVPDQNATLTAIYTAGGSCDSGDPPPPAKVCGQDVVFDGDNDWVNIPDMSFANDFTIEGWVKLAPTINNKDAFIGQEGSGPDINFHAGLARLYVGTDVVVANTPMQPDTWTHLAITRSGSSLSLYLNGTLDATGNWNGTLPVQALGRGNRFSRGSFQGEMDEVRFWDVARSGTQISQNHTQSVATNSTGLVGYWTFNESGQVVVDSSGSSQNASLGVNTKVSNDDPARITTTAPFNENCGEIQNIAPVAQNDTASPISTGGTTTIPVLNNDSDSDGTLVISSVVIGTAPANGTAIVDPITGTIDYTHDGSTVTTDSFTYTVLDNDNAISNIATVNLTITQVTPRNNNNAPIALDDTAGPIAPGGTVTIPVLNNDSDNDDNLDAGSVTIVTTPNNGGVTIDPNTGEINYTHDGSLTTSDNFTYSVKDTVNAISNVATVSISIQECTLDTDGNGNVDALTDGLLFIRHLFGIRGESLIENAVATNCNNCSASEIETYLDQCAATGTSDIDGNGRLDALTDGLLNIRYIFGIRGSALIDNSVGEDCTRCTDVEIEGYLQQLIP